MGKYRGIVYLRTKLKNLKPKLKEKYKYYDMRNVMKDLNISTPPELRSWYTHLGWCKKSVDTLADRVVFREFDNDTFDLNTIYSRNNPDIIFDSAILAALIGSCSFIYIGTDKNGFPRLQVLDSMHATGIIDPITHMLIEGYAILEETVLGNPVMEAYFTPGKTEYYKNGKLFRTIRNIAPYPLLVPVIYRPDATRPFGHSRITKASRDIVQSAMRTSKRAEVAAEFYSFPQKYVVGTSQDREPMDSWRATMSAMIEFSKDEDGDTPKLGQFTQMSMAPHLDQLRQYACLFAGETGLTPDDLGFPSDNPSSAEAIKASHENLRLLARKCQRSFATGFLNAGFLAACIRDTFPYEREQLNETSALWEPIFEPDASMLSSIGDGIIKINQAVPGYIDDKVLRTLTGLKKEHEEKHITKDDFKEV